jgi:hypothetical protein
MAVDIFNLEIAKKKDCYISIHTAVQDYTNFPEI